MNKLQILGTQEFMGIEIPVIEGGFGEDKRCLTDKTIAEIHNQPAREIRKSINRNINRFKVGIDYFDLKDGNQITDNLELLESLGYSNMQISKAEHIYSLSERGYAKLIKIMDTDLAWEIHDKLIDEYFTMREVIKSIEQRKKDLLLDIYNGGQNAIKASSELTEIEVGEATKSLEEKLNFIIENATTVKEFQRVMCILVNCIANKIETNAQNVYSNLYNFLKKKEGMDLYTRCKNEKDRLQNERILSGKPPYSEKTLKDKCSIKSTIKKTEYEKVLHIIKAKAIEEGLTIKELNDALTFNLI